MLTNCDTTRIGMRVLQPYRAGRINTPGNNVATGTGLQCLEVDNRGMTGNMSGYQGVEHLNWAVGLLVVNNFRAKIYRRVIIIQMRF